MKKLIILPFFILLLFATAGCSNQTNEAHNLSLLKDQAKPAADKQAKINYGEMSIAPSSVEKIQVFLFHATQRCATCITIGALAGETVNERFQDELNSGKIEFREVNIDLPENKELARKFQAGGSSLYINTIADGEDHIAQDIKVWQLTNNPSAFKDYLEGKINTLFGKSG